MDAGRLKPRPGEEDQRNWLLFKERDPAADTSIDILAARPESVKSGRRIEELVEKPKEPPKAVKLNPGALAGAAKGAPPERIEPQLATQTILPPEAEKNAKKPELWLHEIKFDGYRTMAHVAEGKVRLVTRGGLDWTKRYGDLPEAFRRLPCPMPSSTARSSCWTRRGSAASRCCRMRFPPGRQQPRLLRLRPPASQRLESFGRPARKAQGTAEEIPCRADPKPLGDPVQRSCGGRRTRALRPGPPRWAWKGSSPNASPPLPRRPVEDLDQDEGAEGGGFRDRRLHRFGGGRGHCVACPRRVGRRELEYRARSGTGFDAQMLKELLVRLEPLRPAPQRSKERPGDHLVRPCSGAHIHYGNGQPDNVLRHAVFKGWADVELSTPVSMSRKRLISDADLAGISITQPTRRLFGKSGPTKLDLAVYYAMMGDFMLPHILAVPFRWYAALPAGRRIASSSGIPLPNAPSVATSQATNSKARRNIPIGRGRERIPGGWRSSASSEFQTGARHASCSASPIASLRSRSRRGHRWREVVEAAIHITAELEALNLVPFVKTSGAGECTSSYRSCRSSTGKKFPSGGERARDPSRGHRSGTLHHHHGQGQPRKAHFHRLPSQRPQPYLGGPLFAARRTNLPASTALSWRI